ncbi:MAG: cell division protein FtsL [Wenzhouxiangellaceae bacterium]|nr:cell division protein FtsL [Wenzhouxiangellaceae bacterium]
MKAWAVLLVLLVANLASALGLIALKHEGRQLFIELERVARQHDEYQVDWSRLQIELAWLGESGRIEQQAASRLDMHPPEVIGVLVAEHE